ncbi:unnamed protein product, partial [Callosobruchus maculatus]
MEDNMPPIKDEIGKIKKESFAEIDVLHNTVDSAIKTESYACTNGIWDLPFTRVKDEQSMENLEQCELNFDTKEHIKMENIAAVDVEVQESEMDSLKLDIRTEELYKYIKPDIENVEKSDGVKEEQSTEDREKYELTCDTKEHINIEDMSAVDVKIEVQESEIDSLKQDMLTEEIDIKPDIGDDAESYGGAKQTLSEDKHGVAYRKSDEGTFVCHICNIIVHSKKDLINHINVSGCSVKSRAKEALTVNKIIKHPEAQYPVKKRHCNATFKRKISLDDHIVRKHEESITSVSSKIHQCKHCSYKTTTIVNLTRHLTKHPESVCKSKQYPCYHCYAIFKRKISLDDHMIRNHEEFGSSVSSKIYQCKHCNYKTTIITNLTRHLTKHPESGSSFTPKQYPCNHCHAIFKRKISLDEHIIRNHEEFITSVSSKIFQCKHCNYKTTITTNFTRHLTKHPESGCSFTPKQYACKHCHAIFQRKVALGDHIIRNHEEF